MRNTIKILVADDEPIGRQLLEAILMPEGYQIVFGTNGQEALDTAIEELPDIILLDVMMPKLDGFEVCKKLRENEATAHTPVYLITALDDRDSRIRGIDSGADDYISKPFDRIEILGKIKNRTQSIINNKRQAPVSGGKSGTESPTPPVISALLDTLLSQFTASVKEDDKLRFANHVDLNNSKHGYFQIKTKQGVYKLFISNKLDSQDAVAANCIFAQLIEKIVQRDSLNLPAKALQKSIIALNELIASKKLALLSTAGFSIALLYQQNDSEEILITGLNQMVFMLQDDLLNPGNGVSYQSFYLQGNQDLKFTTPTKAIILSSNINETISQKEQISYVNDYIKDVPQEEFRSQAVKKFYQTKDFLIIQLIL